jgi:PEP-CTERM motif
VVFNPTINILSVQLVIGRRALAFLTATLVCASSAWATTGACSNASLSSYGTASTANGCWETDKTFSDFTVVNGSIGGFSQNVGQVDIGGSTSGFSNVAVPWTVGTSFTGTSSAGWDFPGGSGTRQNQGTVNMIVNSSQAEFAIPGYPTPTAGDAIYIGKLGLTASGTHDTGGSFSIVETYCIGTAACTSADEVTITVSTAAGASCVAGISSSATCTSPTGTTATFNGGAQVTTINLSDQYTEISVNGANVDLFSFGNSFGEFEDVTTPEPSTFILLGTALAALGVARLRQRKV